MGFLNKRNNKEEMVGVFIKVKIWLSRSVSKIGRRREGRGRDRVQEQVVEGDSPKWRPVVKRM
jgi:hypothetical protein